MEKNSLKKSSHNSKSSDGQKKQTIPLTPLKQNPTFNLYALILILLVGSLCYSNTLHGPFVFDDRSYITEVEGIHLNNFSSAELTKLGQAIQTGANVGRPMGMISFALNYYFGGLNTFGYHLVNLAIHLIAAVLVYLFLKLTLNLPSLQEHYGQHAQEIALISSLLFVTHPIQTQAVNYIFQRVTAMATLFFLLSLYCYGKGRLTESRKQKGYFVASIFAAILAFGSKENAITLPFFIALYEYYFWQRLDLGANKKKWLYTIIGLILVAILLGLIYTNFAPTHWLSEKYQTRSFTPGQRMLTQLRIVIFYISLLIAPLPSRLNLDHHFPLSYSLFDPPTTFICLCLVLGLIAGSLYLAKKRPLISFALVWFWGNLIVESTFLPLELIFEHRLYLPSVGIFLLASIFAVKGFEKLTKQTPVRSWIKRGFFIAMILPFSMFTYQRNMVWQNELTLWEDVTSKSPNKARVRYNLSCLYQKTGELDKAMAELQYALKLVPSFLDIHNHLGGLYSRHFGDIYYRQGNFQRAIKYKYNLGCLYEKTGELDKAIAEFQYTLKLSPKLRDVHNHLGGIYSSQGNFKQAIAEYFEELKLHPDNIDAFNNLESAYKEQKWLQEATAEYQNLIKTDPGYKDAHNNLGKIYLQKGYFRQAVAEFLEEIKFNPDNAEAYRNLGNASREQGNLPQALEQYQSALTLDSNYKDIHNNLGNIYQLQGKLEKAIVEYTKELEIYPNNTTAHYNLGAIHTTKGEIQQAEKKYQLTLQLNPDHALAHRALGSIYLNKNNRTKALFHLKRSLSLDPEQPQASKIRQLIKDAQR